jgi:hypothetical protein
LQPHEHDAIGWFTAARAAVSVKMPRLARSLSLERMLPVLPEAIGRARNGPPGTACARAPLTLACPPKHARQRPEFSRRIQAEIAAI